MEILNPFLGFAVLTGPLWLILIPLPVSINALKTFCNLLFCNVPNCMKMHDAPLLIFPATS